jgi:transcriptional regulator with XRE-family HTH domain
MRLGTVLADWRHANRRSLEDVAKEIGLNDSTYFRLEKGKGLQSDQLFKVLKWLGEEDNE